MAEVAVFEEVIGFESRSVAVGTNATLYELRAVGVPKAVNKRAESSKRCGADARVSPGYREGEDGIARLEGELLAGEDATVHSVK
jgi:hypothetical protein